MAQLDYNAPAEFFAGAARGRRGPPFRYRRFDTAAEAIQFAMESVPPPLLVSVSIQVGDDRLEHTHIRKHYEDPAFPLPRPTA